MRKFFVNKAFAANRRIKGMSTVIKDIPIDTTDEAKLKAIRELYNALGEFYKAVIEYGKGAEKLLFGFYHASTQFNQSLCTAYELIQLKDSINNPSEDSKNGDAGNVEN